MASAGDHYGFIWYMYGVATFEELSLAVNYYITSLVNASSGDTVTTSTLYGNRKYSLNIVYCELS